MSDVPEELRQKFCLALDVDDLVAANRLARDLKGHFGVVKVGLELFTAVGPDVIGAMNDYGYRVFVDLKLHDIPNTVERASRVLGALGASYLTMHAHGGAPMLRAGVTGLMDCEKFGMWNNAGDWLQTSNYNIQHNLHIVAPLGTFPHGQDTEASPSALVVTHNGDAANLVAANIQNNCIIMAPGDTRNAANILTSPFWAGSKVNVKNNAFICDSPVKVTCDVGAVDKTTEAQTIITTQAACRLEGDATDSYRIDPNSSLWSAGVNLDRVNTDAYGTHYYSPPSIGPHEPVRRTSYHMTPGTLG